MKCVAIGGVPATGKTTLVRSLLGFIQPKTKFKYGLLRGYVETKRNISILGIYERQEVFAGTDKLSMAVQSDFDKYIDKFEKNILFEGDRLFTGTNLEKLCNSYDTRIIVLENIPETLDFRHNHRGDNQSEKFKKSRITKINNICTNQRLAKNIEHYSLNTPKETESLAKELNDWLDISSH